MRLVVLVSVLALTAGCISTPSDGGADHAHVGDEGASACREVELYLGPAGWTEDLESITTRVEHTFAASAIVVASEDVDADGLLTLPVNATIAPGHWWINATIYLENSAAPSIGMGLPPLLSVTGIATPLAYPVVMEPNVLYGNRVWMDYTIEDTVYADGHITMHGDRFAHPGTLQAVSDPSVDDEYVDGAKAISRLEFSSC